MQHEFTRVPVSSRSMGRNHDRLDLLVKVRGTRGGRQRVHRACPALARNSIRTRIRGGADTVSVVSLNLD